MQDWIIEVISKFGYWGIALLCFIESVFPPIPSVLVLPISGFVTTYTTMNIWFAILSATSGMLIGDTFWYGLGRFLGAKRIEGLIDKWGGILRIKKVSIAKVEAWFKRKGAKVVFVCRFIPLLRTLIAIPAGIAKMNYALFLLLAALGSLIWSTALISLGAFAGANWQKITGYFSIYSYVLVCILAVAGLFVVIFKIAKKRAAQ